MKHLLFACCLFLTALTAAAAEVVDPGPNLGYLRVRHVGDAAADISEQVTANRSLVLDLRQALAQPGQADVLAMAFAARTGSLPLLILVSPRTDASLVPVLSHLPRGAVTLGVAGSQPAPLIVVTQPADVDQRAYEAAESGLQLEDLVTGKIDKERFDEASLVKEFQNGNPNAAPPAAPDPTRATPEKAPVLTDRVLQRAIHLHRTLIALRPRG